MKYFRKTLAIDFGTSKVTTFVENKGVIVNESSIVTMDTYKNKIISYGETAKKLLGRVPGNVVAKRPLVAGNIIDFNVTEAIIKRAIKKSIGKNFFRPNVLVCIASELTQVQKRAITQAVKLAGANNVVLLEQTIAAAIGCGVNINDPSGTMVVDIGAGKTDISVISNGEIIIAKSLNIGGNTVDEAIADFIRTRYNMLIGENTAEIIKLSIATAYPTSDGKMYEVKGRNVMNGLPMHIFVNSSDISHAIGMTLNKILIAITETLEKTPPELIADLFEKGLILTGGSSLIPGFVELITDRTRLDVINPENPELMVIKGAGRFLKNVDFSNDEIEYLDELKRHVLEQKEQLRKR
ncbi:rod shape-determining protein [uncultured Parvimonas sp.]|uniref:rod shape-determining protein n=1 Tax=uncultured Parvimonas sp. TaxID=747372 RepID=UPI002593E925|nr:rod shape-determining protein [uncultured Parvimonas sp.]